MIILKPFLILMYICFLFACGGSTGSNEPSDTTINDNNTSNPEGLENTENTENTELVVVAEPLSTAEQITQLLSQERRYESFVRLAQQNILDIFEMVNMLSRSSAYAIEKKMEYYPQLVMIEEDQAESLAIFNEILALQETFEAMLTSEVMVQLEDLEARLHTVAQQEDYLQIANDISYEYSRIDLEVREIWAGTRDDYFVEYVERDITFKMLSELPKEMTIAELDETELVLEAEAFIEGLYHLEVEYCLTADYCRTVRFWDDGRDVADFQIKDGVYALSLTLSVIDLVDTEFVVLNEVHFYIRAIDITGSSIYMITQSIPIIK